MITTEQIPRLRQMLKLQAYKFGAFSAEAARAYYELGEGYSQADDFDNAEANLTKACDLYERLGMPEQRDQAKQLLEDIKFYRTGDVEEGNIDQLTLSHFNVPVYVRESGESEKPTSYVEDVKAYFTEEMEKPVVENIAAVVSAASGITPAAAEAPAPTVEEKIKQREMKALDEAITNARMEASRLKQKGSHNTGQLADLLVDLAALHSKKNEPELMEAALVEALSIREVVYGKNHLSVSTDLKNLGRVYFATDDFAKAEVSWKRALQIREAQLGPFHPQVADVADLYAKLLRKLQRDSEADELETRVEESRTRHTSDWEQYRKTAMKAMDMDNFFYAQALWLAALDEASDFEDEDPRVLTTLENLAHVYWKRKKYEKSEPLCMRIFKISEKLLGKEHLDVARAANNLALVCERQGKYTEAAVLYQEVLLVMENQLGADHPDVLATRDSHANAKRESHKQLEQKLQKSNF
ncbi:MAG: tetratricopeptide repeat protein [Candidatus Melainabacteria bacterium]|nr:tetratricopeptide repeat protein [Candidatus Melainabacteria bacterium]